METTANGPLMTPADTSDYVFSSSKLDQSQHRNTAQSAPTEVELNDLKAQLEAAERQRQYDEIKSKLDAIQGQGSEPNEFEGAMQIPDTEKVMQTKRQSQHLIEKIIKRVTHMLSPRPVVSNLIAIGLAFIALHFLRHEVTLAGFGKYQNYIGTGLLIFAALQVIKSSTRSLFIPVVTMIAGAIISHTLPHSEHFLGYTAKFYQYVMITGIIGLGISVLTID